MFQVPGYNIPTCVKCSEHLTNSGNGFYQAVAATATGGGQPALAATVAAAVNNTNNTTNNTTTNNSNNTANNLQQQQMPQQQLQNSTNSTNSLQSQDDSEEVSLKSLKFSSKSKTFLLIQSFFVYLCFKFYAIFLLKLNSKKKSRTLKEGNHLKQSELN